MKTQLNGKLIANWLTFLACTALLCVASRPASAVNTPFILDTFTAPNGNNVGRAPFPINLPGNTYGGGSISANRLSLTDQSAAISIASGNGYTKPTTFQISVDLDLNGMTLPGGVNPILPQERPLGLTVGFFNSINQVDRRVIDGIIYSPDGRLIAVTNTAGGATAVAQANGTFSTNGFHNLSYWVNTDIGNLFDVRFDGTPVTFNNAIPNVFTDANTMFVGVYGVNGDINVGREGFGDNFTLSLPEPSTVMLFGLGGALLWRRRQQNGKLIANGLALLACTAILYVASHPADAVGQTIVRDSFESSSIGLLSGQFPEINLPGNAWTSSTASVVSGKWVSHTDNSAIINIASGGGYTKPTTFQLSADLNLNGATMLANNPTSAGGIPLGLSLVFFPTADSTYRRYVTGITYSPDGRLIMMTNSYPGANSYAVSQSIGLFPTTGFHNLSYWVNTDFGNLFDVRFDGTPVTFNNAIPNVFTDAATMLPGVYGVSLSGSSLFMDNFTIILPEPSTVMLLGLGGAILWRRNRRNA